MGRGGALAALEVDIAAAFAGRGATLTVEALHGLGRSALIDHAELRAQLIGASVLRVPGGQHRGTLGTARVLLRAAFMAPCYRLRPGVLTAHTFARLVSRSAHEHTRVGCPVD